MSGRRGSPSESAAGAYLSALTHASSVFTARSIGPVNNDSPPLSARACRIDKYRKEKVVCEKELGKVTIDSRGAENGGYPAIELDRISGGDISQKMRLGHTDVTLKACYDFYGKPAGPAAGSCCLLEMPYQNFQPAASTYRCPLAQGTLTSHQSMGRSP